MTLGIRRLPSAARLAAWALAVLVIAGTAFFAAPATRPALAACGPTTPQDCIPDNSIVDCLDPPTPAMPDTGISRFFLSAPEVAERGENYERALVYDEFGYAGLQYHTYDLGCGPDGAVAPDALVNTSIANMMLSVSTFVVGLTNSVRERAYDPGSMWGWTDDLIENASRALYDRIFSVLGLVSVVIVGAWLMWSARRGDMSDAATTAGWAVLVMVVTTAVAAWPVKAATLADGTLTGSLQVINGALHPAESESCGTRQCEDDREPAKRASATLTEVVLYKQWLSGELGSSDSDTAKKYGKRLYRSSAMSWQEVSEARKGVDQRNRIVKEKREEWKRVAAEIKKSDPDAYEYLTGKQGTSRIGSAFTSLIAALAAVPFDLMAALLVIVAFLIIRLAVAFLPAIAVIGIMRPMSGPMRGLFRTVMAAIINCVIFGVGASVYLLALELITGTESLAGWQQILLIFLTGVVMWMLLRPFRRITSLAGGNPLTEVASGLGAMRRRAVSDLRAATAAAGSYLSSNEAEDGAESRTGRPETFTRGGSRVAVADAPPQRTPVGATTGPPGAVSSDPGDPTEPAGAGSREGSSTGRTPTPVGRYSGRPEDGGGVDYQDPSHLIGARGEAIPVEAEERFVVYRPDRGYETVEAGVPANRSTGSGSSAAMTPS